MVYNIKNFSVFTCKQGDWIILLKVLSCSDILLFVLFYHYMVWSTYHTEKYKSNQKGCCTIAVTVPFLRKMILMSKCLLLFLDMLPPHLKLRQNFQVQITVLILDIPNGSLNSLLIFLDMYTGYFFFFPETFQSALRRGREDIVELHGTVTKHLCFNVYCWMKKTILKV